MSNSCSLIDAVKPMYGHKVSKSNVKTKRRFLPNTQLSSFDSKLGSKKLRVSVSTIRTITKYGGLDNFLLKIKNRKLTILGKKMKKKLLKTQLTSTGVIA